MAHLNGVQNTRLLISSSRTFDSKSNVSRIASADFRPILDSELVLTWAGISFPRKKVYYKNS